MADSTRIGATVAGYRIESLLGRGGMSIVYLAEHVQLGRQVALKLLAPSLSVDPDFRERFAHESRRAAEVDHPNVVPIFDAGEADGQLYIAMRYIEGCDLKTLIRREGALSVERTLLILEQAADALDAAHDHGLIHRDVKPANILIGEPSDRVYLTDFGVVKHTSSGGLTKTGFFLGTIDYAAPEQIEGLPVDARTDVYALGCVLYECLTGQAPFERDAELAVMHAHLVQPPPVPSAVKPTLPPGLDTVVTTAMAKAKDDRYPTCGDLIAAARQAALDRTGTVFGGAAAAGAAAATAGAAAAAAAPATGESEVEPPPGAETVDAPATPPSAPAAPAETASGAVPVAAAAAAPVAAETAGAGGAPPTEPPAGSGAGRRRGGPSLPVIAAIAVVAALASGAITYFATQGSSSPSSSPTTPSVVTTATTPTTATTATTGTTTTTGTAATGTTTTAEGSLSGPAASFAGPAKVLVSKFADKNVASTCTKSPHPGGEATLNCGAFTADGQPVTLHVDLFGSSAVVSRNYNSDGLGPFAAAGGKRNSGSCDTKTWLGEGAWARGRRVCFVAPGSSESCKKLNVSECSVIYWYYEPENVAVRASVGGPRAQSAPQLATWWADHKNDFGG